MKVFLSADWRNLVNLTYRVPPEILEAYVPPGLELDLMDGHAHVSLVAFDFLNTRVKGFKVPFHTDFPEINLRFYVRHAGRLGVCFLQEFVPKHCIALIANKVYNEPYVAFPMESKTEVREDGRLQLQHRLWKGSSELNLNLTIGPETHIPDASSMEHYFKEHDWGFGKDKKGETLAYFVEHPVWETKEIESIDLQLDFGSIYGKHWEFLNDQKPAYSLFASGSAIKVYSAVKLSEFEDGLPQPKT
jgi:uncharacterized protein YqjF (DUF2071 family)